MKTSKITIATALVWTLGLATPAVAQKMYWIQASTKIYRADLDGSNVELIFEGEFGSVLNGVAVDGAAGKIYWTDSGKDKIKRANLDGTDVVDVITTGLEKPWGIALNPGAGHLYWADGVTSRIQRANLDGSGVQDIIVSEHGPTGLALDLAMGKIYWTEAWGFRIQRANLDGSGVEQLVATEGSLWPISIALDFPGQKMYWTLLDIQTGSVGKIQRANLDGSGVEDVIAAYEDVDVPSEVAIDSAARRMYWTTIWPGWVQRANLDDSMPENLVPDMAIGRGIVLDLYTPPVPTISEWGIVIMGLLLLTVGATIIARRGNCSLIIMCGFLHLLPNPRAAGELVPRTVLPKLATITMASFETDLTIKFRDELKVRAITGQLSSAATPPADLTNVHVVTNQYALTYEPLIALPQATLDHVEDRASQLSGVALAGPWCPELAFFFLYYKMDGCIITTCRDGSGTQSSKRAGT